MKKFFGTPSLTYVFLEPFLSCLQSLLGLDKVATLLEVVVIEVTIVEVVDGKVATLSVAVVKVAILEDGGSKVAILLEGVNIKLAVLKA